MEERLDLDLDDRCGAAAFDPVRYRANVSPDKCAVIDISTDARSTYAELEEQIARCAAVLESTPAAAGERVACLGRNSIAQVVLAMACQRVGAIFVPLNWRLATPELQALVADCEPVLLVCDDEFASAASAVAGPVAVLQQDELSERMSRIAAQRPSDDRVAHVNPAPFALLYTSGTTGRPKGVIITRRNAFFAALNFSLVGEIGPSSIVLSDLPMFHTIGLIAVTLTTLMMGGTLAISDRFLPARTLNRLTDTSIGATHYFGVPQMAVALRAEPAFDGTRLSHLRAIFLGGAPLPKALVDVYLADGVRLVNGYGMSEAGTVAHMPLDAAMIAEHPTAIGKPAPLISARIVDRAGRDVADDSVGELWIKGPSVTPGYWRQPSTTAAAFTDGWFHTGDLVRRNAAGFISIVDRLKDMYISGGENVYPAEVEAALLAMPGIADAAVISARDQRWGETGIAAVVRVSGATLAEDEILAHCATRLARYKCPSRVVFATAIPRTASGKVQKHLLRAAIVSKSSQGA